MRMQINMLHFIIKSYTFREITEACLICNELDKMQSSYVAKLSNGRESSSV